MSGRNNETKLQTALGCAGGLRPAGGGMDTTAGRLGVYPFYQWHRIFSEHTNSAGTVHGLGVGAVAVDSWNLSGEPDFACSYPLLHGGTKAAFRAGDVRGAESSGRSRGQPGIIFSTHPRFGTDCGAISPSFVQMPQPAAIAAAPVAVVSGLARPESGPRRDH